jgi:hypothetical protein
MRSIFSVGIALTLAASPAAAQDAFHSVQSANLPTATTMPQGSWLFEISHRFNTPVSEGSDALWGLDGPVINRFGLSYGAHDRVLLGILRSNFEDNVELNAKVGLLDGGEGSLPVQVALMGGVGRLCPDRRHRAVCPTGAARCGAAGQCRLAVEPVWMGGVPRRV